jgi:hypothetical protein
VAATPGTVLLSRFLSNFGSTKSLVNFEPLMCALWWIVEGARDCLVEFRVEGGMRGTEAESERERKRKERQRLRERERESFTGMYP